jgi:hypothetical protein
VVPAPESDTLIPPTFAKNYSSFSRDYSVFKKRREISKTTSTTTTPPATTKAQLALYTEIEERKEAEEFLRRAQDLLTDLEKAAEEVKPGASAGVLKRPEAVQIQSVAEELKKEFPAAIPTITPEQILNAPKLDTRDKSLNP